MLLCFALAPTARAVDPPPDGGYLNGNTAEGQDALFSLTTGVDNTAIGFAALYSNTTGGYNAADGFQALYSNTTGAYNVANGGARSDYHTAKARLSIQARGAAEANQSAHFRLGEGKQPA